MNSSAPVWVVILVAILGSTALSSVVSVVASRRKLGAETGALSATATETITKAASEVLRESRDDNSRLRQENASLRIKQAEDEIRIDKLERQALTDRRRSEEWMRVLQLHAAWDALAIARVREAIPPIDLPDAPPLTPATQER